MLAGCCHGFAYEGPFALYYPNSALGLSPDQGYFPAQILEALGNLGVCGILLWYDKRTKRTTELIFLYLGLYATFRFFLEMLRGDKIRGGISFFSTSQLISLILLPIGIILLQGKWIQKIN